MSIDQQSSAQRPDPKVSVVMSVYNGAAYLSKAIESILEQTFTDFEFIIINDGSTDNSPAILQDFARRDSRIRVINQENTGLTLALRSGCEAAIGQYIARMDADDFSMPIRFEKQVALLDKDSKLVAVTGDVEHFTNEGTITNVTQLGANPKLLSFYNCFCNSIGGHGQVMFRSDAYKAAGGYDATFRMAQDYDLWTRLLTLGNFGNVPEIVYRYRTGHDNISNRSKDDQSHFSMRTTRREYERMTGEELDADSAKILLNFWWYRPPPTGMGRKNFAASRAMGKVAQVFFRHHPNLRDEKFRVFRDIAAKWWWWTKRVPPFSVDRAIYLCNFAEWGLRAFFARVRYGKRR